MKRLIGVMVLTLLVLTACTSMKVGEMPNFTQRVGEKFPDDIILSWTENPVDTQTVAWKSKSNKEAKVEYFEIDSENKMTGDIMTVNAKTEEFNKRYLNSAVMINLKEKTKYAYRVGNAGKWSNYSKFLSGTDDKEKFKFVLLGDSQSGDASNPDYKPLEKVLGTVYSKNNDIKFVMSLGDLVEIGEALNHWDNWFDAVEGYFNNTSFMAVQGNHENLSLEEADDVKPKMYLKQMFLPENGPEGQIEQAYSFEFGDAKFIVLNSQIREEEKFDDKIAEKEIVWLENELKTSKKAWNILFFHKPIFYSHEKRANDSIKKLFQPIIDKYNVDLVFNGHDHAISRTFPIKGDDFYEKPSQGTIYYTTGRTGDKIYTHVKQKVWNDFFYDSLESTSYLTVEIDDGVAVINTYLGNGDLIDEFVIDKKMDKISNRTEFFKKSEKTKMVIYGSEINYDGLDTDTVIYNEKLYIPLAPLLKFTEGRIKKMEDKRRLNIYDIKVSFYFDPEKKPTIRAKEIEADNLYIKDDIIYISKDTLEKIYGFNIKKSDKQNILYLER